VFNLHDVFQEHNTGVKRDSHIIIILHYIYTLCRTSYTVNKLMRHNGLVLHWKNALYQSTRNLP